MVREASSQFQQTAKEIARCQLLTTSEESEADGIQTRNPRIDSPVR